MTFRADLHVHSPYSHATSKHITPESMAEAALKKGIDVLGTGDILHPSWLDMFIQESDNGGMVDVYGVKFIPTVEVSCEWNRYKIHVLLVFPRMGVADRVRCELVRVAGGDRLRENGRPVLPLSLLQLQELVKEIDTDILFIPAHILTPYYGILGKNNGLDSIWEVLSRQPDALETGLSADIGMCRAISELDNIPLVSFSDAHSTPKIGREVTVIDGEITVDNILNSIKNGNVTTIEYYPQLGKYHYTGHRDCNVSIPLANPIMCPKCNRRMTVGVNYRVEELRDRPIQIDDDQPYIVPLMDVLAYLENEKEYSKRLFKKYDEIVRENKELDLLLTAKGKGLDKRLTGLLQIIKWRQIKIRPGHDGKFGELVDLSVEIKNLLIESERAYLMRGEKYDPGCDFMMKARELEERMVDGMVEWCEWNEKNVV